jgi:transcriptional regulator with PAS, ATPase and Fis domain
VVRSDAMKRLYDVAERIAKGTISVLILGETGVGKEVLAEWIHRSSPRADKPYLRLNCAAFSDALVESELFGHERGSFTGAAASKLGLLETAEGGTVFLDEVGELPMALQAKLLRVLETHEVVRVGALKPKKIDVRFIAATNRDLEAEVLQSRFRQDLYFRLNGATLVIPPLRERIPELEELCSSFLHQAALGLGRPPPRLSPPALDALNGYWWPGNLRELRNVLERAVLLCGGDDILPEHLPLEKMGGLIRESATNDRAARTTHSSSQRAVPATPSPPSGSTDMRQTILDALGQCAGNQSRAAKLLGISRRTLVTRLDELGLPRPRK